MIHTRWRELASIPQHVRVPLQRGRSKRDDLFSHGGAVSGRIRASPSLPTLLSLPPRLHLLQLHSISSPEAISPNSSCNPIALPSNTMSPGVTNVLQSGFRGASDETTPTKCASDPAGEDRTLSSLKSSPSDTTMRHSSSLGATSVSAHSSRLRPDVVASVWVVAQ